MLMITDSFFFLSFNVCAVVVAAADGDNDIEIGHLQVETIRASPILSAGLKICPSFCARIWLQYAQHVLDVNHLE